MLRSRVALVSVVLSLATIGAAGQSQNSDQNVSLGIPGGATVTGVLRVPSTTRPPVILLVTGTDAADLATGLAAEKIASLRVNANSAEVLAQWISFLRNDERFPLVSVFAEGIDLPAGVIAGRAARADGIATRGDTAPASAELARVVATLKTIDAASPADTARQLAAFARSVPALGRRGNPSPSRTVARRSLRHTEMAIVGGVRMAIEWGQPQKRDREIWGALVPWGAVWMPGADEATVLTTDGPVTIGTVEVPAGDHTLYAEPTAERFELLLSRDVGVFHTVRNPALIIGRTDMTLNTKSDSVEGLTFSIGPAADGHTATLSLSWDKREYRTTIADQGHFQREQRVLPDWLRTGDVQSGWQAAQHRREGRSSERRSPHPKPLLLAVARQVRPDCGPGGVRGAVKGDWQHAAGRQHPDARRDCPYRTAR